MLLFLLLAVFSVLTLNHTKKRIASTKKKTLDSFIKEATYISYNTQGKLKTKLTATQVMHYKEKDTTYFLQPQMVMYTKGRTPWHIRADSGTSLHESHLITLQGNVVIHQLQKTGHPETTIKTIRLTIYPKKSRAMTNAFVTIYRRDSVIHGKGLTANLKTGEYQLLSQSEGVFEIDQDNKKTMSADRKQATKKG